MIGLRTHQELQAVLNPGYELYKDERAKVSYSVPQGTEIETYRRAVEELPGQENPAAFGLHPNADLTFRSLQVQAAVQLIADTRPSGGPAEGNGMSKEDIVDQICADLLSKVCLVLLYCASDLGILIKRVLNEPVKYRCPRCSAWTA